MRSLATAATTGSGEGTRVRHLVPGDKTGEHKGEARHARDSPSTHSAREVRGLNKRHGLRGG
jgi:hypothetical protein